MFGYHHRLLTVDLNSGKIETIPVPETRFEKYVGGGALAARMFLETAGHSIDPSAPANPLFIMTGPLAGTTFPGSSRFAMCARSPLTGIWGESASGGHFGAELKKAGFDGIVIAGRSGHPVCLEIRDGRAALEPADALWGLDTYDTVDRLAGIGPRGRRPRVLAIGPAGENLVKFAAVCNDKAHYFGRTGMGAVMGGKRLKAVTVRGSGSVSIADRTGFDAARKEALAAVRDSMISDSFRALGTAAAMDMGMMTGDVPIRNWRLGVAYDLADAVGGPAISEKILRGRKACYACPIGCKPVVDVDTPRYRLDGVPGPEYETCAAFGSLIMNSDLEALAYVNDRCNRLGMDTISCGATMAFVMEAVERGLLSRHEVDGLDLSWGNIGAVIELVEKTARRQGFGNRTADGSRALAESIGPPAEDFCVSVKGLELPMHDPRAFHGLGLAYVNSSRGACHLQHSVQAVEQGMVCWPEAGLAEDYLAADSRGKGAMVFVCENIGQMVNAAGVCHFVHWAMGLGPLIRGLSALTGFDFDMRRFLETGERAWILKRALVNLMGVTRAHDRLPRRIRTPLAEGGAAGSVPDEDAMKKEYDGVRGLDSNGFPRPEVLRRLKLDFLVPLLGDIGR